MEVNNIVKKVYEAKNPIDKLWADLIKLKHKMTKDQYKTLQVDGEINIKLEPNEVNLLDTKYGKFFEFSENSIKMK